MHQDFQLIPGMSNQAALHAEVADGGVEAFLGGFQIASRSRDIALGAREIALHAAEVVRNRCQQLLTLLQLTLGLSDLLAQGGGARCNLPLCLANPRLKIAGRRFQIGFSRAHLVDQGLVAQLYAVYEGLLRFFRLLDSRAELVGEVS